MPSVCPPLPSIYRSSNHTHTYTYIHISSYVFGLSHAYTPPRLAFVLPAAWRRGAHENNRLPFVSGPPRPSLHLSLSLYTHIHIYTYFVPWYASRRRPGSWTLALRPPPGPLLPQKQSLFPALCVASPAAPPRPRPHTSARPHPLSRLFTRTARPPGPAPASGPVFAFAPLAVLPPTTLVLLLPPLISSPIYTLLSLFNPPPPFF